MLAKTDCQASRTPAEDHLLSTTISSLLLNVVLFKAANVYVPREDGLSSLPVRQEQNECVRRILLSAMLHMPFAICCSLSRKFGVIVRRGYGLILTDSCYLMKKYNTEKNCTDTAELIMFTISLLMTFQPLLS